MSRFSRLFKSPSDWSRNELILLNTEHLGKFQWGTSHFAQLICNPISDFFISSAMIFTLKLITYYIWFGKISFNCWFCNVQSKFSELKDSWNSTAWYFTLDKSFVRDLRFLRLVFDVSQKLFITLLLFGRSLLGFLRCLAILDVIDFVWFFTICLTVINYIGRALSIFWWLLLSLS